MRCTVIWQHQTSMLCCSAAGSCNESRRHHGDTVCTVLLACAAPPRPAAYTGNQSVFPRPRCEHPRRQIKAMLAGSRRRSTSTSYLDTGEQKPTRFVCRASMHRTSVCGLAATMRTQPLPHAPIREKSQKATRKQDTPRQLFDQHIKARALHSSIQHTHEAQIAMHRKCSFQNQLERGLLT